MEYSPRVPLAKHKASLVLALALGGIGLSLFSPLMLWVTLLCLCAVTVRISLYLGWYPQPPSTRTINLLAILSILALGWFSFKLGLLLAMVNLLVTACSLKLMVMRNQKDFLQLFLSLLFLCGCGYIFEQGLTFVAVYTLLVIAVFLALGLQYASNQSVFSQLRMLGVLSFQALPIAALLFVIFPQIPPLWKMPSTNSSSTGLSEQISPGDIASLSQSSALAFRARFNGEIPSPQERYWRAIILEAFDGKEWRVSPRRKALDRQQVLTNTRFSPQTNGRSWQYRVFAEASRQRWLFTLDVPTPATTDTAQKIWPRPTYQFYAQQPLMSSMAYDVVSYPDVLLNQSNENVDRFLNLQVPSSTNPRTQEWAQRLQSSYPDEQQRIEAVLNYFRQQNFSYTLNPPLMQQDSVDKFLFDEQTGFCAHYASAMAYTLRLTGIPARVVAGYQGGEMLSENVMSIYQYDAHAWVEAWFDDRGWIRFDPTGVVAPDRLQYGLERALLDSNEFLANEPLSLRRLQHLPFLGELRDYLNQMDYLWSHWVLGFDKKQQQDLFENIVGDITLNKMMALMLAVVGIISAILTVYFIPSLRKPSQPVHLKMYLKAVAKIEQATGVKRHKQAPHAFLDEVQPRLSSQAYASFLTISQCFIKQEYADDTSANTTSKAMLKRHLNNLSRALKTKNRP